MKAGSVKWFTTVVGANQSTTRTIFTRKPSVKSELKLKVNEGRVQGMKFKLPLLDLLIPVMIGQLRFCLGRLTLADEQLDLIQ